MPLYITNKFPNNKLRSTKRNFNEILDNVNVRSI